MESNREKFYSEAKQRSNPSTVHLSIVQGSPFWLLNIYVHAKNAVIQICYRRNLQVSNKTRYAGGSWFSALGSP